MKKLSTLSKTLFKKKYSIVFIPALLIIISIISFESCSKSREISKTESMINSYYAPLKAIVGTSYDYVLKNIISGTQVQIKQGGLLISPFISPVIQNTKVISVNDPNSSTEYKNFYSNYVTAIRSSSLKSHENFFSFGISEIQKLSNEQEKQSAAFLIALGTSSFEYLFNNLDRVSKCTSILADENMRKKYIDPNTGLLQMNVTPSASTLKVIAVIVVVVAAAVLTYGAAVTWATAAVTAGGLGWGAASYMTIGLGVIGGIGAGITSYVGVCPPVLGAATCGLT